MVDKTNQYMRKFSSVPSHQHCQGPPKHAGCVKCQVPDHDDTILGAREENVPHCTQAKYGACVARQDVHAVLLEGM